MKIKLLYLLHGLTAVLFFIYSFTQVDLALTLTSNGLFNGIFKMLQHIGFFERQLSSAVYFFLLMWFFGIYIYTLYLAYHKRIRIREVYYISAIYCVFFIFSYPALSYDIFNYMFTAKTVVFYQKNPYLVTPLAFFGFDPWVSVMRWIHLPSAYTPVWIMMSLPVYIFGLGKFVLTLLNFKILLAFFYLLSVVVLKRILSVIQSDAVLPGVVFFALNPLVLIESIYSPHNDIVLVAVALVSYLAYLLNRKLWSYFLLALSVSIKLMTVFLYPAAFGGWKRRTVMYCMLAAVIVGFVRKELLPWYFLWLMPFLALNTDFGVVIYSGIGFSAGLLLRYAPYLYMGKYDALTDLWRNILTVVPVVLAVAFYFLQLKIGKPSRK